MFNDRRRTPGNPGRTLYLVAAAGHPNYSDEVTLRVWLSLLARVEPEATVWVDCPDPGQAAALHQGAHPNLRFTDTLFRLCADAPADAVGDYVTGALDDPGQAPRMVSGIALVKSASVVHIIGGGMINSIWPRYSGLIFAAMWLRQNTSALVAASGLGLMPVDDVLTNVWDLGADAFATLALRDQPSADLFEPHVGALLRPDDIFLGSVSTLLDPRAATAPEFMLCVQADMAEDRFQEIEKVVRCTLDAWGATGATIGVVECLPRMDRRIFDALKEDYPGLRFYSVWDILKDGFPAAPHQQWISTRYHAHLLAAAAGARGVTLSVRDDYYDVKHAAARRLGSTWTHATVADLENVAGEAGPIVARAEDHRRSLVALAKRIYS